MRFISRAPLWLAAALLSACSTVPMSATAPTPARQVTGVKASEPPVSADARRRYEQALKAMAAGRLGEAERALKELTQREPALAGPHANLGILYARRGRASDAIASLQQAIRLNPDNAAYHNELGRLLRQEGRFDEARRAYMKAIDLKPDYAYAHLNIGILYDLYLNEQEKALAHYQRYHELVPDDASVNKWIVELQRRRAAQDRTSTGGNG